MTKTRTWEDNATEYRELVTEAEGWVLGGLVACGSQNDTTRPRHILKASWTEFGKRAGVSTDSVKRAYTAWERAAEAGLVPDPADLEPTDFDRLKLPSNVDHPWKEFHKGQSRNEAGDKRARVLNDDPEALVRDLRPEQRAAVLHEIGKADPAALVTEIGSKMQSDPGVADRVYRSAPSALHQAKFRADNERVADEELGVIARGGSLTPASDNTGSPIDSGLRRAAAFSRVRNLIEQAKEVLIEERRIERFTSADEETIQGYALMLLSTIDEEAML